MTSSGSHSTPRSREFDDPLGCYGIRVRAELDIATFDTDPRELLPERIAEALEPKLAHAVGPVLQGGVLRPSTLGDQHHARGRPLPEPVRRAGLRPTLTLARVATSA